MLSISEINEPVFQRKLGKVFFKRWLQDIFRTGEDKQAPWQTRVKGVAVHHVSTEVVTQSTNSIFRA